MENIDKTSVISIKNLGDFNAKVESLAGHTLFFVQIHPKITKGGEVKYKERSYNITDLSQYNRELMVLVTKEA